MNGNIWDGWQFLLGEWTGEGGGQPGQGEAVFNFYPDLDGKILVRKNTTRYPETPSQLALTHDDLIIVYQENEQNTRAIYFDNEGHVIHYQVVLNANENTVIFNSDTLLPGPRFRLTYSNTSDTTITIRFEIAPPDQPESFSTYTLGTARRREIP